MISRIPGVLAEVQADHNSRLQEARSALTKAEDLNRQMKSMLDQSMAAADTAGNDPARNWDIPGSVEEMNSEPLRKLREQAASLILPSSEFSTMDNNLGEQEQAAMNLEPAVSGLPAVLSALSGSSGEYSGMVTGVLNASGTIHSYIQNYGEHGSIITAEAAQIDGRRTSDSGRRQTEQQAKTKLGEAMKLLNEIRGLGESAEEAVERYRSLRQYYEENVSFNEGIEQEATVTVNSGDQYTAGKSSMKNMDGLYSAMSSVLKAPGTDCIKQSIQQCISVILIYRR